MGLLDGEILLLHPTTAIACVLDGRTARLWIECIGQPFSEMEEPGALHEGDDRRELFELFRVLRLFGMIGDAAPTGEDSCPPLCSPFPRTEEFRFRGSLVESGDQLEAVVESDGTRCTLTLGASLDQEGSTAAPTIVIKGAVEGAGHQVRGLEAITALALAAPGTPIDVLTRLATTCPVMVRPAEEL